MRGENKTTKTKAVVRSKKVIKKVNSQPTAAKPKPKTATLRGFLIPFVFMMIFLLVVGTHLWLGSSAGRLNRGRGNPPLSAKPVDTSLWTEYKNDSYHYSFKFPPSWQLTEDTNQLVQKEQQSGLPLLTKSETFGVTDYSPFVSDLYLNFYIFVKPGGQLAGNETCQSLADCVQKFNASLAGDSDWEIKDLKKDTFLGLEVMTERVDRPVAKWSHYYTFIFNSGNFYILKFTTNYDKYNEGLKEFLPILKTFKFSP